MKIGAVCEHSDEERKEYFDKLVKNNVLCVDMEALALGAITHKVGIRAAFLSVVVDGVIGVHEVSAQSFYRTQVFKCCTKYAAFQDPATPEQMLEWQSRPGVIVAGYIKRHLKS